MNRTAVACSCSFLAACMGTGETPPKDLPKESYERPAEEPHTKSDYAFRLSQMPSFYDAPGEFGHYLEGQDYGFEGLSFILTETHPCGGPPLHTHDSEEAHVLLDGKASYVIGGKQFTIEGPYVARVPAKMPHTFVNVGAREFNLVAVFPDKKPTYQRVGDNPLVKGCPRD